MTVKTMNSVMLAGFGLILLIGAHGVAVWSGIGWIGKSGGWLPWIAGGALAIGLYHVIQAFGLVYIVKHIRGRGHGHFHVFGEHTHDGGDVERGPHGGPFVNLGHGFVEITIVEVRASPHFRLFFHDKNKQARSVPRNATVAIDTVRPDQTLQTFAFHANGDYLESTTEIPKPHEFKAIVNVSHGTHTHTHEVHF
jgi:hypothetical protein